MVVRCSQPLHKKKLIVVVPRGQAKRAKALLIKVASFDTWNADGSKSAEEVEMYWLTVKGLKGVASGADVARLRKVATVRME